MTRAELESRLRRADAALKVERPRWTEVREGARRALRLRQAGVAAVAVAVFVAVVAGALLARAALDDDAKGSDGGGPPATMPDLTGKVQGGLLVVTNSGDGRAGAFRVTVGETELLSSAGLGPGESASAEVRRLPCPPGADTLAAKIDVDDAVQESSEDDNTVALPCETEAPKARPDLTGEVRRGLLVVTNSGDGPAGPFRVMAGETELMDSPGLDPGATAEAKLKRPPCPPGAQEIDATIDAGESVDESDEDDNVVLVPCEQAPD